MRATVLYGAGDVRIESVPDARLIDSTDALVTVSRACICGSDLWPYKLMEPVETGRRMGHEAIGVVEAVGSGVRTLKVGDVVVMPFAFSDGTCVFCHEGLHTSCVHGGFFGTPDVAGAQAEAVRVPQADGTLFVLPVGPDDALMPSLLTLSDVLGTGHHAAVSADGVLRQRPGQRRPRAGAPLHRGAAAGHPRGPDRARSCLRPSRPARRGARRVSRDGRPRGDQGHGRAVSLQLRSLLEPGGE